jgi:hypothetical protein
MRAGRYHRVVQTNAQIGAFPGIKSEVNRLVMRKSSKQDRNVDPLNLNTLTPHEHILSAFEGME